MWHLSSSRIIGYRTPVLPEGKMFPDFTDTEFIMPVFSAGHIPEPGQISDRAVGILKLNHDGCTAFQENGFVSSSCSK
jgi:hypothetical protein